jgi:ABC-2 type transport system ATP-binding protein
MGRMDALLAVDGLVKRYGKRAALRGVTFTVRAGEVVALLGPNGAGKSTTLSILASLLAPDGGSVAVAGHRLPDGAREAKRAIGFVPQQISLYPTLTARENLRFFARMQGLGRAAAAEATIRGLALVALEERADELVATFSGGMRRRLNLACGIVHAPRVLLLDEPTVGVDPQSRERIYEAVTALTRGGAAVLYSTHDMEEAERLCDRVVLLDGGIVVATGSPAELVSQAGMSSRIHLRTVRTLPSGWLDGVGGARVVGGAGSEALVALDEPSDVSTTLLCASRAGGEIVELTFHRPNLADVFFAMTGRALRDESGASAALH